MCTGSGRLAVLPLHEMRKKHRQKWPSVSVLSKWMYFKNSSKRFNFIDCEWYYVRLLSRSLPILYLQWQGEKHLGLWYPAIILPISKECWAVSLAQQVESNVPDQLFLEKVLFSSMEALDRTWILTFWLMLYFCACMLSGFPTAYWFATVPVSQVHISSFSLD